ncbi:trypsin-like peptidase domain-containing protein [Metapseudomonas otitidis]|uniref:trypsin-like peptidase domain-containing protein n=1 Tax=Metapseudomonas otitidis TaxID=319939 RepID=UPI0013F64AAB|nr:trypsin-like peptidase domain-containing protein [Pseudomonas otitidis]
MSSSDAGAVFLGSAVQWNQRYAVSAAHIPSLSNVVHRCSTGCDLVFIRRDAKAPPPTWRSAITGEALETVGQSPLLITVKGTGTSKAQRVRLNEKGDHTSYALSDAPVVEGMSGGPVYGADDAVVGMTVGIYLPSLPLPPSLANSETLTVYVPYDIIQREWQLYSARNGLERDPRLDMVLQASSTKSYRSPRVSSSSRTP